MADWLASTCLFIWIWKSHRILFFTAFCGISQLDLSYTVHIFTQGHLYGYVVQRMLLLPASYSLSLYVGLSMNPLCIICTLSLVKCASMDLLLWACSSAPMISASGLSFSAVFKSSPFQPLVEMYIPLGSLIGC